VDGWLFFGKNGVEHETGGHNTTAAQTTTTTATAKQHHQMINHFVIIIKSFGRSFLWCSGSFGAVQVWKDMNDGGGCDGGVVMLVACGVGCVCLSFSSFTLIFF